jgi:hypothetical protein
LSNRAGSLEPGPAPFALDCKLGAHQGCYHPRPSILQVQLSHILPGCRESACGPPALWLGHRSRPRPAKRRRLSCRLIDGKIVFNRPLSHWMVFRCSTGHGNIFSLVPALPRDFVRTTFNNKGQIFIDCPPRTRGQGGRHGLEWAPRHPTA